MIRREIQKITDLNVFLKKEHR